MPNLMPFDELNAFKSIVTEYKTEPLTLFEKEKKREEIFDLIEYILLESYYYGTVQAMSDLGLLDKDPQDLIDDTKMEMTINVEVAGKNWRDRITEYLDDENSTVEDFQRVAETDSTRIYNTAVVDGGKASGIQGVRKQWITMEDERVRSTHEYLQDMIVPLDEDFYTYDGDHAPAPGLFSDPANVVNCRCSLTLIY